ncbi:sugar-transfer associated ATP-grasp domain-containing protein [Pseudonocardia nigra]|uniref:sugar-transfer associated ATP-grasp domain-containing protein n=1 Tax=Pseudonocardia nigra TaxID=1921578 RepID=UPI001C5E9405|nr:sugar-transfer associated ATP-grasp domain-containing protein [Pseudonocardia nigra]
MSMTVLPRKPRPVVRPIDAALRRWDRVMGLNARNDLISRTNPPAAVRLVNDKIATKRALTAHGIPVSETLVVLDSRRALARLDWDALPDAWALKPSQSLGGSGILLAVRRSPTGDGWESASGRQIPIRTVRDHVRCILDGEFSPGGTDVAFMEPLIAAHPTLDDLSYRGLPDIRVICVDDRPLTAMLRLPTAASGGKANLHQRAIGAAVDLATGAVVRAWTDGRITDVHPDTGRTVTGVRVPHWDAVVGAASRCAAATGLRYVGADVVVDAVHGPLLLEVNARPGLQIQNVTGRGLLDILPPEVAA